MINLIKRKINYRKSPPAVRAIFWVLLFNFLLYIIFIPGFLAFSHISFRTIENTEIKNKLQYGQDTIKAQLAEISTITRDYANWTATYEFVETRDKTFIFENLGDDALKNLNLNFVAVINLAGEIVYEHTVDFQGSEIIAIDFQAAALLKKYPELAVQSESNPDGTEGIVQLDSILLIANSRPILTSQRQGPARGSLVFGRFLNEQEDQKLSQAAHFKIFTQRLDDPGASDEMRLANYVLTGAESASIIDPRPFQCNACHKITRGTLTPVVADRSFILPVSAGFLGGYTILDDLHQNPTVLIGIHIPRSVEDLESKYSTLFLLFYFGLMSVLSVIGAITITRSIKMEEARAQEYRLLRAVIDNVPEQIYAHDVNGKFLLNNLCDARAMGVDNPEDLRGKSDFDFYPPDKAALYQETEKAVVRTGQAVIDAEEVVTRASGKEHWILTTKTPMRDELGEITGIVGISRDITERKQREREMEAIIMMSHVLRSAETSTQLLVLIYNQVIDMLHADFGTLELIDSLTGDAEVVFSSGLPGMLTGQRIPPNKGLNSFIRASRRPYLENDLSRNPMALDLLAQSGCTAAAGAPLIAEDALIGFLWMGRKSSISEEEVSLLAAMADIAASSIRRMTLHELTEKRLNQLTSLRRIDVSINSSKELAVTLGVVLEQALAQLQADAAAILLIKQDSQILEFELGQGFARQVFDRQSLHLDDGPAGLAARDRKLVQIRSLAELGAGHPLVIAAQSEGFVSYFAAPLLVDSEIKGVMEVYFRREFSPDRDWVNFLETLAGQAAIAIEQAHLFTGLQDSNRELVLAYDETIEGWVKALDMRDKETEGHSLRVTQVCVQLAAALGIGGEELVHIRRGALLHDIGKVGTPDAILLKPGSLNPEEWRIMRRHPQLAYEMLAPIEYLRPALPIPFCHHEKWDGTGYPRGLGGEEIPLAARIFAVVDVWDALSNDRPYRAAWTKEATLDYIKKQAGLHFDPAVVEKFLQMIQG